MLNRHARSMEKRMERYMVEEGNITRGRMKFVERLDRMMVMTLGTHECYICCLPPGLHYFIHAACHRRNNHANNVTALSIPSFELRCAGSGNTDIVPIDRLNPRLLSLGTWDDSFP